MYQGYQTHQHLYKNQKNLFFCKNQNNDVNKLFAEKLPVFSSSEEWKPCLVKKLPIKVEENFFRNKKWTILAAGMHLWLCPEMSPSVFVVPVRFLLKFLMFSFWRRKKPVFKITGKVAERWKKFLDWPVDHTPSWLWLLTRENDLKWKCHFWSKWKTNLRQNIKICSLFWMEKF